MVLDWSIEIKIYTVYLQQTSKSRSYDPLVGIQGDGICSLTPHTQKIDPWVLRDPTATPKGVKISQGLGMAHFWYRLKVDLD